MKAIKSNFNRLLGKKMALENKKLTISDVSRLTGISLKTLENTWSSGNDILQIHSPTAIKLCEFFGCGIGELIEMGSNNDKPV